MIGQLNIFHQPPTACPKHGTEHLGVLTGICQACWAEQEERLTALAMEELARRPRGQLTELPGESFEDIFGDAA